MRVIVSAPRKSGGAHLRCLLSMAYDLKAPPVSAPERRDRAGIAAWMAELPEQSVSTCDIPYALLLGPAAATGVRMVGVIRHPFDLFVSRHDVAQQRATRGRMDNESALTWSVLTGEELAGAVALQYAKGDFAGEVASLREWSASGNSIRFEDLLVNPATALASLSGALGPLTDEEIGHAVDLCPAENVVASRPGQGRRMPSLPPGAWKHRLPAGLLDVLCQCYGSDVSELGYDGSRYSGEEGRDL